MPQIAAAISFQVLLAGGVGSIITGAITSFASSFVLSGLQKMIAGKPKSASLSGARGTLSGGITQQVKQPIIIRKPVYGEVYRSGGLLYHTTTNNNKYLHMVVEVAPHEVEEIGEIWINETSIPPDHLDANGNVTQGLYANKIRIRKHLGSADQTADSFLVSESSEWTTSHRLRGIAYIYVRMDWDQDKFPSGIPNVAAWVKGKKIYDPRTTLTRYSVNPALIINDYLTDTKFGMSVAAENVDETYLNAAANICDEFVTVAEYNIDVSSISASTDIITLDGSLLYLQTGDKVRVLTDDTLPSGITADTDYYVVSYQRKTTCRIRLSASYEDALNGVYIDITDAGTGNHTVRKTAEPRYTAGGVIETDQMPKDIIEDILTSMNGVSVYTGGVHKVFAGAYQTPSIYFDESNIMSAISVQTKVSGRERFNAVRGTYTSQINKGQPSDYPEYKNDTYISQDNEEKVHQADLPFTQRPHMAQRIAKQSLELSRQEITWSADFDLKALQVIAMDNAYFTVDSMGWDEKVFQIKEWAIAYKEDNGTVIPVIRMTMREIASGCYDWNSGEETAVDLAPNTNFPSIYEVQAVTGFGISSEKVDTQLGDATYKVLAQWDLSDDSFVLNGGNYELQYKLSSDTEYRPTFIIPGNFNFAEVTLAAQLNENYDIRIRAVNSLGVRSGFTTLLSYAVGTSGGVGTTIDWGNWVDSPSTTEDWGNWTDSVGTTDDWGYYT